MATKVLRKGQWIRIGDDIPPYMIATVELAMTRYQRQQYERIHRLYVPHLSEKHSGDPEANTGSGSVASSNRLEETGRRDFGQHRRLCLATFDTRLESFCNRTEQEF